MGKKTPKLPLPFGFRYSAGGRLSQGHMQHAQKLCKDRACNSGDILARGQSNTH